jgi:hypothetical protein
MPFMFIALQLIKVKFKTCKFVMSTFGDDGIQVQVIVIRACKTYQKFKANPEEVPAN